MRRLIAGPPILAQAGLLAAGLYLVGLLAPALRGRRRAAPPARGRPRVVVLVPAHNEAAGIGATLAALSAQDYPRDRYEVLVVADHCTDDTRDAARQAGCDDVLERTEGEATGKGAALAWGIDRIFERDTHVDAVAVIDADCIPSPNFMTAAAARLEAGQRVIQSAYHVSNPGDSASAGMRYAAFALINYVRPLAKTELGLSAGLLGTGMVFSSEILRRHPWQAFSLTEDLEYHLMLLEAGERVSFAPEMSVVSAMPVDAGDSASQQSRWEAGRATAARVWAPRLLGRGASRRDPVLLHAGAELLIPPQSIHMAANLALGLAAAPLRSRRLAALSALAVLAQIAFVVGGLVVARAPREAYAALARTPLLIRDKGVIAIRMVTGQGAQSWVPTARDGSDGAEESGQPSA